MHTSDHIGKHIKFSQAQAVARYECVSDIGVSARGFDALSVASPNELAMRIVVQGPEGDFQGTPNTCGSSNLHWHDTMDKDLHRVCGFSLLQTP